MNDWIIIDTQELRKKYAPKRTSDEYWDSAFGEWRPCDSVTGDYGLCIYRRRAPSPWKSIKDEPPTPGILVWLCGGSVNRPLTYYYTDTMSKLGYTHWMPVEIPEPPAVPLDPAEEAWLKYAKAGGLENTHHTLSDWKFWYKAGFDRGRNSK